MRILIINYHYFIYGGPDSYFFNITAALKSAGHEVIPFCFDYDESYESPYRSNFPDPITGRGPCLLRSQKLSVGKQFLAATRMFWNPEVDRKFRQVLDQYKPDLVYSIYLSSSMLPRILHIAKREFGIPVIYRLSDYHMFCASYHFLRKGVICKECVDRSSACISHRCMQSSLAASLLRYLQMQFVKRMKWYNAVDYFICPSQVMAFCLTNYAGISKDRVIHLPSFTKDLMVESDIGRPISTPYFLFVGKIAHEKGAEVLVRAFNSIHFPSMRLRLVGDCDPIYRDYLSSLLDIEHQKLVDFVGRKHGLELVSEIKFCAFVVAPSIWLENMPNTVIEALSANKPVVTSDIGSLPEIINEGDEGLLVPPCDVEALAMALEKLCDGHELTAFGMRPRLAFKTHYTSKVHMNRLCAVLLNVKKYI